MSVRIQLRRDTAANWASTNPTLTQGEPGYETDTGKIKYGDGSTAWNSLEYAPSAAIVDGTIVNADVNASAAIAGSKISPDFGSQNVTTTGTSTAASFIPTSSTVPTNGVYLPAANSVALSTNGTGRLFVNASGNVGVNKSPAVTIDSASTGSNCTLALNRTDAAVAGQLQISAGNNANSILGTGTKDLFFSTNALERLRITSAGLVGIGTSSPTGKLTIGGTQSNGVPALDLSPYSANLTATSDIVLSNNGCISALSSIVNITTGTGFFTWANNATAKNTGAAGATELMRLDGQGRLGIGTTSPNAPLNVVSTTRPQVVIAAPSSDGANLRFQNSTTGSGVTDGLFVGIDNTATASIYNYENTDLLFGTNSAERARIDTSGRLLVGTSTARANLNNSTDSAALQIEGTGTNRRFSITSCEANAGAGVLALLHQRSGTTGGNTILQDGDGVGVIVFGGNDGSEFVNTAQIAAQVDGTPGANDMPGRLVFSVTADGSASPSEAMRINNAGELLVGYTSDNGAYKLQVNSQIFATSAIIATSDGRYKENVAALDGCVDLVKALRPVSFDWKAQEPVTRVDEDGETVVVREAHNFPDGKQVGFIAQEVEEVLADKPWLGSVIKQNVRPAVTDADGNELAPEEEFLGIAEGNLVAVLTSALKDAIGRIESLEAEVAALKA